jgi:hypothetical protein
VYLLIIHPQGYTLEENHGKATQGIFVEIIPCEGYILGYGKSAAMGLEVREVRAHLGAEQAKCARTEGLPQVQIALLEYSPAEAEGSQREVVIQLK